MNRRIYREYCQTLSISEINYTHFMRMLPLFLFGQTDCDQTDIDNQINSWNSFPERFSVMHIDK